MKEIIDRYNLKFRPTKATPPSEEAGPSCS